MIYIKMTPKPDYNVICTSILSKIFLKYLICGLKISCKIHTCIKTIVVVASWEKGGITVLPPNNMILEFDISILQCQIVFWTMVGVKMIMKP